MSTPFSRCGFSTWSFDRHCTYAQAPVVTTQGEMVSMEKVCSNGSRDAEGIASQISYESTTKEET